MKYTYKALFILLASFAGLIITNELVEIEWNTLHLSLLALFMFGSSLAVHHSTIRASKENPKRFPAYFMAITGIKMLVYIVFLGVYVFVFQKEAIPVVVGFLILYLAFTVLEVFSAVKMVRTND